MVDLEPYELPGLALRMLQYATGFTSDDRKYQPGDEHKVFIVTSGDYADYGIRKVFVGNREAAHLWAAQFDRCEGYGAAEVEEHEDDSADSAGAVKQYRTPFVVVKYRTDIAAETAKVTLNLATAQVSADRINPMVTDEYVVGNRRLPDYVRITTTGQDADLATVDELHSARVANIRATIKESLA